MNVRKRGLALLMCICMIFTLLPFSALADATAQDVVYGTYSGTTWTPQKGLTAENVPYTNNTTGADVKYSKTATPVDGEDDAYNVTLKIESTTKETAPGASAVVLVIDNSNSMTDDRLNSAKAAAKAFVDSYGKSGSGRYIALVSFATYAKKYDFSEGWWPWRDKVYWLDASNADNRIAINASIDKMGRNGGTNFEQGLSAANDLLKDGAVYKKISKDNKFVIALTDGQPTYWGSGYLSGGTGNSCDETTYNKTIAAADTLKKTAEYLYTVCYGAENETIDYSKETVGDFLENRIASTGKAYNAADGGDSLSKAFAQIYKSIEQGISSGFTVTDPMGQYVNLDSASLTVNGASVNNGTITWEPKNGNTVDNPDGSKTTTYTLTYKVTLGEVPEDDTYPLNKDTTLEFKDGETAKTLHFNVPGVYREAPKYKVTYEFEGNYPDSVKVPASEQHKAGETVTMPEINAPEGWIFNGWKYDSEPVTSVEMPAGDITIIGTFTEQKAYTVKYLLKDTDISVKDADTGTKNVGESVEATAPDLPGYTFAGTDADKNQTITVVSDASKNVITFYYYKNVTVTPNNANKTYGDDDPAITATVSGTRDNETVVYTVGRQAGEDVGNYAITPTGDEIQGYYKVEYKTGSFEITARPVTLTGESDTRTYTGQEIELTNIEQSGLLDGHTFSGVRYSAKGTDARTEPYPGEFSDKENLVIKDAADNDVTHNYNVEYKTGALTINPIGTVTVTIKGNHDSKVYNGTEQSVTGYTVKISDPKYTEADFKFTGDPKASRTDVGTTPMGLNAHQFENKNSNFKNVTFVIENDGYVEVTPRTVTLTSETASKPYDGTPLTKPEVTVTGDGFVDGEVTDIKATGSVTNVSDSPVTNTIVYTTTDKFVAGNYNITKSEGTLTITKSDKLTVSATGYDGKYDGQTHNGNVTATEGATLSYSTDNGETWTATEPTIKNVGEINVIVKASMANYSDATAKYTLKVTPRTVTLTSETASKPYDGTPLTKPEVTVTGDGFVDGEVADIIATGSVTNVSEGEVTNAITFVPGDAFNAGNYKIEKSEGKLSITPLAVTVTAKDYTKYVGEKDPVLEATVTGTINNDTIDYTISRDAGETVGTYTITPAGAEAQGNYTVTYKTGTLTIKERPYRPNPSITDKITVEITGNSDSVVYDGTEHSVKDYTVKISDSRYTEKDFTFSGKALASGINAGTYEMGLKAEQFKNTNARFTNVKFVIKADGVLTITPKELTITAGSKTEYGPTPVTCDEWTVSGLAVGDKVESVKITGIQSVPGSSPNVPSDAVIKNAKGEDVTKNYAIKYVNGTLTMLEVLNKEDHFNYIIGTPEGLSLPTANVTRAEVATIFFRLMTDDARAKFDSLDNNFSDVAKGQWYNRAISTLANAGIIKGDPAGTYRPGDAITRAEMATIIARFGDFKEGGKTFNDISGHWAQKYIELAASNGWINGNPDGTFKPNNNITRAETVAMINRVLDRQTKDVSDLLPVSQMTNWSDNMDTAKWYYRDMQEATNNHKAERVGNSIYEKWTEKLPDIDWASYQI